MVKEAAGEDEESGEGSLVVKVNYILEYGVDEATEYGAMPF